jgi:hypothetical protein
MVMWVTVKNLTSSAGRADTPATTKDAGGPVSKDKAATQLSYAASTGQDYYCGSLRVQMREPQEQAKD